MSVLAPKAIGRIARSMLFVSSSSWMSSNVESWAALKQTTLSAGANKQSSQCNRLLLAQGIMICAEFTS